MKRPVTIIAFTGLFLGPALSAQALFQPSGANFYVLQKGAKQFILRQSRVTGSGLDKRLGQLSSGERITNAGVDPAGLAVAEQMDALVRGLRRQALNSADYKNYLRHAEGMIAQNHGIVQRIRAVILRSTGGIMNAQDREIAQTEIDQLVDQIDMNARFSQFNKKLIIADLTAEALKLRSIDLAKKPYAAIKITDAALKKLSRRRALAGVKENTLNFKIKGQSYYLVNAVQSMSRISDTDMAAAMTEFQKDSVLIKTQTGTLMMARQR